MSGSILFTKNKLESLRNIYGTALKAGKTNDDLILFEGHELLMGYAKYLILYLEGIYGRK